MPCPATQPSRGLVRGRLIVPRKEARPTVLQEGGRRRATETFYVNSCALHARPAPSALRLCWVFRRRCATPPAPCPDLGQRAEPHRARRERLADSAGRLRSQQVACFVGSEVLVHGRNDGCEFGHRFRCTQTNSEVAHATASQAGTARQGRGNRGEQVCPPPEQGEGDGVNLVIKKASRRPAAVCLQCDDDSAAHRRPLRPRKGCRAVHQPRPRRLEELVAR